MSKSRLTKFEVECMERRARGRAAWGMLESFNRQQKLDKEVADLCAELSFSHCSRQEIEEKIKEFKRSKSNGFLYIG